MVVGIDALDHKLGARSTYCLGCDLGQSIDATALVVIERRVEDTGKTEMVKGEHEGAMNPRRVLKVCHIVKGAELLPLGTDYHAIAEHIAARRLQLAELGSAELVFDETGARAAGDLIRAAVPNAVAVVLTGSEKDENHGRRWSVSKANMVTSLLAAIEAKDLQLADLDDKDRFIEHLVDLRRKVSSLGHFSFNALSGKHDDYCTAAGLAWWRLTHRSRSPAMFKLRGW